jgi:hypothetical protein
MAERVERECGAHPAQRRRWRPPGPLLRGQATTGASFGFCSWQSALSRPPTWLTRCVKRSRSVRSKSPQSPGRSDLERTSMQTILGKFRRCECGDTRSWAAHSDRYGLFPIGLRAIPQSVRRHACRRQAASIMRPAWVMWFAVRTRVCPSTVSSIPKNPRRSGRLVDGPERTTRQYLHRAAG